MRRPPASLFPPRTLLTEWGRPWPVPAGGSAALEDTWVEVIITWVAAAKTATVTVNGTERGLFTEADVIPSDRTLYAFTQAVGPSDANDYFYTDRIECYAGGELTDVP